MAVVRSELQLLILNFASCEATNTVSIVHGKWEY